MRMIINYVESGAYKGSDIKFKGLIPKPVIIKKSLLLGKSEVRIDKTTVKSYDVISTQNVVGTTHFKSRIVFKDGKECCVYVSDVIHNSIMKLLG